MLQSLLTDGFASVPPQLAAVTSLRNLGFTNVRFNMTAAGLDTLLALPHLTSLKLPRLSAAGQQVAEQLRSARPELAVRQPRR